MKKCILSFYLLATALILSACGTKEYNMTFDEAVQASKASKLTDFFSDADKAEQDFKFESKINDQDGNELAINISSDSKQSLSEALAEANININADFGTKDNMINADGNIEFKVIPETLYLNLHSLNITGAGAQDLAMYTAMIAGFQNQRYSIPAEGIETALNELKNYLSELNEKNDQYDNLYIQEGELTKYNGKYSDYEGYNAWKFSLNPELLDEILADYSNGLDSVLENSEYSSVAAINDEIINNNEEEIDENEDVEIVEENTEVIENLENSINNVKSDLNSSNVTNFEGYLVITNKDEVAVIIENMELSYNGSIITASLVSGKEGVEFQMSSEGQDILIFKALKSGTKYNVNFEIPNTISLKGTISPKLSKSEFSTKFDLTLSANSATTEGLLEDDVNIPLKGSWTFKKVNSVSVSAPEGAQNLSQLLGSFLGGGMYDDSSFDDSYDDYSDEDYEDIDWNDYVVEE